MRRHAFAAALDSLSPAQRVGYVTRISPGRIEATGPMTTIGELCTIQTAARSGTPGSILAEVVSVATDHIVLVPLDTAASVSLDARVIANPKQTMAPAGDSFAGRVIDSFGDSLDGLPAPLPDRRLALSGDILRPFDRIDSKAFLETGIKALDGLLSIGRGQRIGIFAASGVGKTSLMRQLAIQAQCDHCVVCLVGERGHEVEHLWQAVAHDRKRYTCVAATSDLSASVRVRAVYQALALAENWRTQGKHVLLIIDSITRFAMALREIGLASGAPPTLRAYTPNVFSALPRVVERCGASKAGGSITAAITVLSETDDVDDPIVEVMKSLLDGHIILSRQLADRGHFPAIDVVRSVSRQSETLVSPAHAALARRALAVLARYEESRLLVESGLYKTGTIGTLDDAIRLRERLATFLRQSSAKHIPVPETLATLSAALEGGPVNA